VKPKDKDSGDVERFRLRQVTNRDGRAVALDRLTLRLQTLPRREGYWLDTGMLKTGFAIVLGRGFISCGPRKLHF